MLINVLFILYFLKGQMDFNETCTDIFWEMQKNCLDFGDLDLIFKVTGGKRI